MREKIANKIQNLMPTFLQLFVNNNETVRRMECDVLTDQILTLLKEEIEKVEIPESPEKMPIDKYNDVVMDKIIAFEYGAKMYRKKILSLLRPIKNPVGSADL